MVVGGGVVVVRGAVFGPVFTGAVAATVAFVGGAVGASVTTGGGVGVGGAAAVSVGVGAGTGDAAAGAFASGLSFERTTASTMIAPTANVVAKPSITCRDDVGFAGAGGVMKLGRDECVSTCATPGIEACVSTGAMLDIDGSSCGSGSVAIMRRGAGV